MSTSARWSQDSPRPSMVETASGEFVDVGRPSPTTLHLADIATHLGNVCRFGGAVSRFYSVAEHSVLVHDLLGSMWADRDVCRAGLFHDAPEYVLQDLVSPLKYELRRREREIWSGKCADSRGLERFRSTYDHVTRDMEHAMCERFGLDFAALKHPDLHVADMWALKIEAGELKHSRGAHWTWMGELPNHGALPDDVDWVCGLAPAAAASKWLEVVAVYDVTDDDLGVDAHAA